MASGSNTDGERVTTGSEPRRLTVGQIADSLRAVVDDRRLLLPSHDTERAWRNAAEHVEREFGSAQVVERGRDERPATREPDESEMLEVAGIAAREAHERTVKAVVEALREDRCFHSAQIVEGRFNLKGTDDGRP